MLHLYKSIPFKQIRFNSTSAIVERLTSRSLLKISGDEVSNFIQGLITNDIAHLSNQSSLFTMFLNTQGRVLFDTIFYKDATKNSYIIECESSLSESVQKHLKMYRVRRKIDIVDLGNEMEVYALYCTTGDSPVPPELTDCVVHKDPRIAQLGFRILARPNLNLTEILDASPPKDRNFRWLRYSLGVGEGVNDLPPGDCFPLECNCDYLHGVSFHKGCYVGQELTARVHHTGVVRKRLMPIIFSKIPSSTPEVNKINQDGTNLGKLRGIEQDSGLGLLRTDKALGVDMKIGDGVGRTVVPAWWPTEAMKEINVQKS